MHTHTYARILSLPQVIFGSQLNTSDKNGTTSLFFTGTVLSQPHVPPFFYARYIMWLASTTPILYLTCQLALASDTDRYPVPLSAILPRHMTHQCPASCASYRYMHIHVHICMYACMHASMHVRIFHDSYGSPRVSSYLTRVCMYVLQLSRLGSECRHGDEWPGSCCCKRKCSHTFEPCHRCTKQESLYLNSSCGARMCGRCVCATIRNIRKHSVSGG
jgi:hypothetical protein